MRKGNKELFELKGFWFGMIMGCKWQNYKILNDREVSVTRIMKNFECQN